MFKDLPSIFCCVCSFAITAQAAPCGAVFYRQNSPVHYSHFNVPEDAVHHFFGFLEGPAWENNYCAYRVYVDSADRNAIDFIVKYKPVAILQNFDNPSIDEHNDNSWGTDCFSIGSTMGLGAFRLFYNNQWVNPRIGKAGKNLDSMVIAIPDSSTQTPKVTITYYGWNLGAGKKITAIWTISTTWNERPTHCEVKIIGDFSGKVAIGITNNNKRGHPVTLIKDSTKVLLATIGRQGAKGEGFTDTMLLAAFTSKKFFSSFAETADNYGMLLSPDENQSVKWSFVYSMALETTPFYRGQNWRDSLVTATTTLRDIRRGHSAYLNPPIIASNFMDAYTISGRKIFLSNNHPFPSLLFSGQIIIVREANGCLKKIIGK
jgi:hypothetical protein